MNSSAIGPGWDESASAPGRLFEQTGAVFAGLFETSVDAIWLYDPQTNRLVDCNQAALKLVGAETKQQVLQTRPEDISPPVQADGTGTTRKTAEIIALVEQRKSHRFEWTLRRFDGRDVPLEVSSTAVLIGGRSIHVIISRDISERKKAESDLVEMAHALERRVTERTAELSASEARFRAMVEHAPEAIVVYNADTGRFMFGNQHACDLYGVPMSKLAELTPMDVSPEFQPCGTRTSDLARDKTTEVLAGGIAVVEWTHQKPDGQLVPTEVRLLRLPAEGQNLIRASIMDNTERKRAERALRESEEKFRALFEGSSQGVVLHDENELLGHILTNLLSNAVKYSENDAQVGFSVARSGTDAVCTIRDEGIGIPEADQSRLFTAFHRGANVGNRSGTGLGLVLVKRCAELHGGRVEIRSAAAKGTTVTVCFPAFLGGL